MNSFPSFSQYPILIKGSVQRNQVDIMDVHKLQVCDHKHQVDENEFQDAGHQKLILASFLEAKIKHTLQDEGENEMNKIDDFRFLITEYVSFMLLLNPLNLLYHIF